MLSQRYYRKNGVLNEFSSFFLFVFILNPNLAIVVQTFPYGYYFENVFEFSGKNKT